MQPKCVKSVKIEKSQKYKTFFGRKFIIKLSRSLDKSVFYGKAGLGDLLRLSCIFD
jgi:hypothetical protein